MKKWFVGGAIFVVVYALFVVARTPAQWVIKQAELPNTITLNGINGTIWNANIDSVVVNEYVINAVETHVNLLSLFTLNPSVDITFGGALVNGPEGYATVGNLLSDIKVNNAKVSVLANDIAKELTLPIPLTAKKYIDVTLNEFVMGKPICSQLDGKVNWDNASVNALDEKVNLGSLKADLSCDKGKGVITFDPKNNLGLTMVVNVQSTNRVYGSGYIQPGSKFPTALKEVLPFLGKADNQGRYKLSF